MTIYHNVYTKACPHMTFPEILCLYGRVKSLPKDAKILELGAWKGGSTIPIGTASLGTNRKITVVDIWDGPDKDLYDIWLENITMGGLAHLIEIRRGDSLDILKQLLAEDRQEYYDFCFLDTSHEYDQTNIEFDLVYRLVKSGGWIFMHDIGDDLFDCLYPGCTKVWYEKARHKLVNHKRVDAFYGGRKV
jgi:predicted O-methyltransferase YrrM